MSLLPGQMTCTSELGRPGLAIRKSISTPRHRHTFVQACAAKRTSGVSNPKSLTPATPQSWYKSQGNKSLDRSRSICLATGGGDKPPSGGGPPGKPPGIPNDESDDEEHDPDDDEVVHLEEAQQAAAAQGIELPEDFLEAARGEGLRKSILEIYFKLQRGWITRFICNSSTFFRDRLLYDPRFLFIVLAEIAIDCACATYAEVTKRGKEFWNEFEYYLSDLSVGLVLDVLLVGLMATPCVISKHHTAHNATGLKKLIARTPKAVFEANTVGEPAYTVGQRLFCLVVKFGEYSLAGIVCGIVGHAMAEGLMKVKHAIRGEDSHSNGGEEAKQVVMTGLTWGAFMGGSSNLRYQTVFACERLVDKTIAHRFPKAPFVISFILRLYNNVWGGMNFIDHARWTGIQPEETEDAVAH